MARPGIMGKFDTLLSPPHTRPASPNRGYSLPTQIRRSLPAALAALVLFFVFFSHRLYASVRPTPDPFFPRKIWQTWKVNPLWFDERDSNVAKSWINQNPSYQHEVLTDDNSLAYVERNFGPNGINRPDIVYFYRELTTRIVKADLLRYMIMYVEGGLYADIDVEALRPVHQFIPERWNERDIDMVIGIEIDEPDYVGHPILGQKCQSFCQWTFMCKPRQPVMMALIEGIMKWLKGVADKQRVSISDVHLDFDQIISGTGPSAFTKAVLAEMKKRTGHDVDWKNFHDLRESKLIGGILVNTVEAFAAGQGHSDSGNHDSKHAMVRHHYHASKWPTTHPRLNHPMYGEVETCNWNPDCVRKWDADTLAFDALPEEEKKRLLAIKEKEDAEAAAQEEAEAAAEAAQQAEAQAKVAADAAKEAAAAAAPGL